MDQATKTDPSSPIGSPIEGAGRYMSEETLRSLLQSYRAAARTERDNGNSAFEWVMERQCVKIDKASGIVNDATRYAVETAGNPAHPLELFQRVITISLETMKIVRALRKLEVAS